MLQKYWSPKKNQVVLNLIIKIKILEISFVCIKNNLNDYYNNMYLVVGSFI